MIRQETARHQQQNLGKPGLPCPISLGHTSRCSTTLFPILFFLVASCIAFFGCSSNDADQQNAQNHSTNNALSESNNDDETSSSDEDEATNLELTPIDKAGLAARIAELEGQVVLVDFWSITCAPCIKNLPEVERIDQEHRGTGLHTISICIGDPNDEAGVTTAKRILHSNSATFEHRISDYEEGKEALAAFEITQVPHYLLFARDGAQVGSYSGKPDNLEETIINLLDEAIPTPPPGEGEARFQDDDSTGDE